MNIKSLIVLVSTLSLSACSTVKMPNLDFLGAGFEEDARNIDQTIPSVEEVPPVPSDVRSTAEWDQSAKEMIQIRDGFELPVSRQPPITEQAFDARFEELKSRAQAYKEDDPQ